jgi:hypothetical protein
MFGVFIFKAKPEDKNYPFKKEPKQPLKMTDEEMVKMVKITPKMTYFCHHKPDLDKSSDEDKILSTKQYWDNDYSTFKKMRGCENSYQTDDGKYFIRVVSHDKEWFGRHFNNN